MLLKTAFLVLVVAYSSFNGVQARGPGQLRQEGPAVLPDLPYDYGDLEPCIDAETMRIHHDLLHKEHVDKLNEALKDSKNFANEKVDRLIRWVGTKKLPGKYDRVVRRHGGGAYNHDLFWRLMIAKKFHKDPNDALSDNLMDAIKDKFGDINTMMKNFTDMATESVFGSGWVWLCAKDRHGDLMLTWTQNQDNPMMYGISAHHSKPCVPILALDMWEHAYMLKYKNKRGDYANCFWQIVNWDQVNLNYDTARKFFQSEMNEAQPDTTS